VIYFEIGFIRIDGILLQMKSLKEKTVSGLIWTFSELIIGYISKFIVGIVLARLLEPRDFGLVGMVMVFITFSQILVVSGFGAALIKKQNATNDDYSTVFFFNLSISLVLFILLFLTSSLISKFYNQPDLLLISKVLPLVIVIDSLSIVQRAKLRKKLRFKIITAITLSASFASGIVGVILAFNNYGVWSLIIMTFTGSTLSAVLFWYFGKWIPNFVFKKSSFFELFNFSFKILLSQMVIRSYRNLFYMIVGKVYSAEILGFYYKAESLMNLSSHQISKTLQKVTFPILATIQDENIQLRRAYRKLIRTASYISSFLVAFLFINAENIITLLYGDKWSTSAEFLKILCFAGLFIPLHEINISLLQVKGRSDLFLGIETFKKAIAIPLLIGASLLGFNYLLYFLVIISFLDFLINSFFTKRIIDYGTIEQLKDISPSLLIAAIAASAAYSILFLNIESKLIALSLQTALMLFVFVFVSLLIKREELLEGVNLIKHKLFKKN
jgi:teichuronic acid exporter